MFALYLNPWNEAPDQLAWQLTINDAAESGSFSYNQLIHYPSEGGSVLLSLISLLFKTVNSVIPSLSIVALLVDTLSRLIQLLIVRKVADSKVAYYFSIWTILSVPLLFSWSSVNFGLHHIASFLPFVCLLLFSRPITNFSPWLFGAFCGLAMAFSYDNLIIIITMVAAIVSGIIPVTKKFAFLLKFFLALGFLFLPHILARTVLDNSFDLEGAHSFIRGIGVTNLISKDGFQHLLELWYKPLPGAFFLLGTARNYYLIFRFLMLFILLFTFIKALKHWNQISWVKPIFILIISFLVLYAFSPFYEVSGSSVHYVSYRHLCYVLPLIVLLILKVAVESTKRGHLLAKLWIVVCIIGSSLFMWNAKPFQTAAYKPTGWILASKFGHDPSLLVRIQRNVPASDKKELFEGFGWGITAALFSHENDEEKSLDELKRLIHQFPKQYRAHVVKGVQFAFDPAVTPKLPPTLLLKINKKLELKTGLSD
ncbi:MAG: hypothetical protein QE487_17905 [Fluviicola sp.]|nr:hypothetical protein [Fluviicola sp.]